MRTIKRTFKEEFGDLWYRSGDARLCKHFVESFVGSPLPPRVIVSLSDRPSEGWATLNLMSYPNTRSKKPKFLLGYVEVNWEPRLITESLRMLLSEKLAKYIESTRFTGDRFPCSHTFYLKIERAK